MTPSKIVGSFWFTEHSGRSFGIVKVQTSDGLRFYIGHANGKDEKQDSAYINKYGSPLNINQLKDFLTIPRKGSATWIHPVKIDVKEERNHNGELLGMMMVGIGIGLAIATYFI